MDEGCQLGDVWMQRSGSGIGRYRTTFLLLYSSPYRRIRHRMSHMDRRDLFMAVSGYDVRIHYSNLHCFDITTSHAKGPYVFSSVIAIRENLSFRTMQACMLRVPPVLLPQTSCG